MTEKVQFIPSRLKSCVEGGYVAGAGDIVDDTNGKSQETINAEVSEALGTGGSVDSRITAAVNALDSSKSQSAGADGLALNIVEENGKITSISGSIASNTYDTYGAAANEATRAQNAESTLGGRVTTLETAVGSGGSVDSRIAAAKAEIKGNATTACDTLGEAEALISAEKARAQGAEQLLQEQYNALTQSDIIVGALPASGTKNKIYRVPGTNTYSDYMWNGSSFVKMATYDNAIDDEPTVGSNNLVKSGGIISGRRLDKNYIYSLTIYRGVIPFNLYYSNNRWRLSIYSCYYSFGSNTNLYQITAQEKECSIGNVSADPYATTLYVVFDISSIKTFDVYNNAQISNALANNQNLYVVAIGSIRSDGVNNFVSTFNFNVFGCQVNIKTNIIHDLYPLTTYKGAILFNLYYQNNDWYIDEYSVYINKLNHLGESGNNTLVQEHIGVAQNLSYVSADVEGYYYYLFFNIGDNTLKLCTITEYRTLIADSSWQLIGYGNLGINNPKTFKCNVPFLLNGRIVSYSVLGSINNPKKVLWLGTSIPAGSTYPTNSCSALNRTCVNNARGTSWMCVRSLDTPAVAPDYDMSLTKTYAEFDTQYSPLVSEGKLSQDTLTFWKWNYSYESLVMSHISDYDVVVIDHIYNDFIDNIDLNNIDWNTRDRGNFIGAFNYLVDKILEANPFIKIIISTYFQNVTNDNQKSLSNIQKGIDILEKIAEHYGYPILQPYKYCQFNGEFVKGTSNYINDYNQTHGTTYTKLWEDENGNIKRFQMYCIDGVHPYTDEAKEYLDKVYTHLLTGLL